MARKRHIAVLGGGESGTGAALLAQGMGYEVRLSDSGPIAPAYRARLEAAGVSFESGQHSAEWLLGQSYWDRAGLLVKSPGIPPEASILRQARDLNIPIISEIEWAYRFAGRCTLVAITGTNGKTTTTTLTHHLLRTAGLNAYLAGNVGNSFAELVWQHLQAGNTDPSRIYVLETSSFQLEDIRYFKPKIAALLNITTDHMDRYGNSMERYAAAKFRIRENQKSSDFFLYNAADPVTLDYLTRHPFLGPKVVAIRPTDILPEGICIKKRLFALLDTALIGPHNALNAAFAVRMALALRAAPDAIQQGLQTYTPPAHRMEVVARANGITWINDSKATNVDAVKYALQAMTTPVVWIAGGVDKGNDYAALLPLVREKVKAIVCLGTDNHKLQAAFASLGKPLYEVQSAEAAVEWAARLSRPGDTVLLSPACASFDLFKNYEDRGDQFRRAVLQRISST